MVRIRNESLPLVPNPMAAPVLLLAITACILMAPLVARIPYHIVINYNEGWNAYYAQQAFEWKNIYDSGDALIQNNYPPLSFYLTGAAATLVGDALIGGRWVALLSLFLTSANLYFTIFLTTRSRGASLFGAVYFAAFIAAYCQDYVGMNDPQMLAHALMTASLVILAGGVNRPLAWMGAPLFMILAGMIKHNLVAFPLAATTFVAFQGPKLFAKWLGLCLALLALSGLLCHTLFGSAFFASILTSREFSTSKIIDEMTEYLPSILPLVAVWTLGVFSTPRRHHDLLILFYVLFSALVGFFFFGGQGVNVNALFDLFIALSWGVGAALGRMLESAFCNSNHYPGAAWAACMVLILNLVPTLPGNIQPWQNMHGQLTALESKTMADAEYLAAIPGPVLCTTPALGYWAAKPFEYDPFNTWQAVQMGRLDAEAVFGKIRSHHYGAIQLESISPGDSQDFRTRLLREVERYYTLDRQSVCGYFFIPLKSQDMRSEEPWEWR